VGGREIGGVPVYELAETVGLVFQNPAAQLFLNSVREELAFSLKSLNLTPREQEARIQATLERFGLLDLADQTPFKLSGGQRKKVGLAAVLCRDSSVVVFDEPTTGQDFIQNKLLESLIAEESANGKTIIVVTHDVGFCARVTNRLVLMAGGRIVADGPTGELLARAPILARASVTQPFLPAFLQLLSDRDVQVPAGVTTRAELANFIIRARRPGGV
jgi:energy-coupling factor transport system ATP-binding protein